MPAVARRTSTQAGQGTPSRRHRPDYWLVVISALLLSIGLVVVYSISPGLAAEQNVAQSYFVNHQLLVVGLGVLAFIIVANTPLATWKRLRIPLLVLAAVAALAVRLFGEEVNGAYRWIEIGGVSFQAAELIKFALLVWVAGFLSERLQSGALGDFKQTIVPLMASAAVIGVVVGGLQSDFGSMAVMLAMVGAMIFVAGVPLRRLLWFAAAAAALAAVAIIPFDYRQQRLATFFNPSQDCLTTGYQTCQALVTVGSGGLDGLGLGRSVQAYGYLPEAESDSIFAIYAEKFGFIGVAALLALFLALFTRIKRTAERSPDMFPRLLVVGIFAWFSMQSIINIGAMLGLLPLKGITLPFISYGGTSIVFVMIAVGLVFQISRYSLYNTSHGHTHTQGGGKYDGSSNGRRFRGAYNSSVGRRS